MGTNYYLHRAGGPCETCGHDPCGPVWHIGKSSGGWCFALHVEPSQPGFPKTWEDWLVALRVGRIVDEYGRELTFENMIEVITDRGGFSKPDSRWLVANNAVPGPNGLARRRLDGQHCVGHGEGTYDLIIGEFC